MEYFTTGFGKYVGNHDKIRCEHDGFTLIAMVEYDYHMGEPWKEHDCHGDVSDWTSRAKAPGEVIIKQDGCNYRYYDMAGAVAKAKQEGWGCRLPDGTYELPGETKGQIAVRAAQHDYVMMKAWCDDMWYWCHVTVKIKRDGVALGCAALGGIECNYPGSDNAYLLEVANELVDEAMDEAKAKLAELVAKWQFAIAVDTDISDK